MLIAEDQGRLQEMVSNLDQQCKHYGMRISRDKTEVMVTNREPIPVAYPGFFFGCPYLNGFLYLPFGSMLRLAQIR